MNILSLIRDMFLSPGTPEGAYERAAAAFGHGMIGVLIFGLVMCMRRGSSAWAGAAAAGLAYALTWELAQIAFAGSSVADSAIDAAAVLCGAIIAACLWARTLPFILIAATVLAFLGTIAPKGQDRDR